MRSMTSARATVVAAAVTALTAFAALPAAAQQQAGTGMQRPTRNFPATGTAAPDFSATATDSTGRAIPVSLSALRGKVVVLAFYPLDRSSGCTIELTKFRDDYSKIFGGSSDVVVLPTSVDTLGSHASWAKDAHFPFAMIADPKAEVATKYSTQGMSAQRPYFARTVFVVDKKGNISFENTRFNPSSQDDYDRLQAAVAAAKAQ